MNNNYENNNDNNYSACSNNGADSNNNNEKNNLNKNKNKSWFGKKTNIIKSIFPTNENRTKRKNSERNIIKEKNFIEVVDYDSNHNSIQNETENNYDKFNNRIITNKNNTNTNNNNNNSNIYKNKAETIFSIKKIDKLENLDERVNEGDKTKNFFSNNNNTSLHSPSNSFASKSAFDSSNNFIRNIDISNEHKD